MLVAATWKDVKDEYYPSSNPREFVFVEDGKRIKARVGHHEYYPTYRAAGLMLRNNDFITKYVQFFGKEGTQAEPAKLFVEVSGMNVVSKQFPLPSDITRTIAKKYGGRKRKQTMRRRRRTQRKI